MKQMFSVFVVLALFGTPALACEKLSDKGANEPRPSLAVLSEKAAVIAPAAGQQKAEAAAKQDHDAHKDHKKSEKN